MDFNEFRSRLKATIVFGVLLAILCHSLAVLAAAPAKVVIAHAGMNARTVILWTGQEQKFFAKYGTDALGRYECRATVRSAARRKSSRCANTRRP